MAQKYVFVSGKGGVGKSSVALGLARSMSEKGLRVLIADFDIGLRSLDLMLGVSETVVFDWGDVLLGRCSIKDAVINNGSLAFFPAPVEYDEAFTAEEVKKLFEVLDGDFDFMLFDAPAGVGRVFELACAPAEKAVLVTTPDSVCVRSCSVAAAKVRSLGIEKPELIINRFVEKPVTKGRLLNLDDCIDSVAAKLIGVVPEDFAIVTSSVTGEQPGKNSPAAKAFDRICLRMNGERVPLFED
ncbi:MAG: P-loop NTPase [Clostridia bacterium]|nr:P-loop NTPase [Clostridia bacterium]